MEKGLAGLAGSAIEISTVQIRTVQVRRTCMRYLVSTLRTMASQVQQSHVETGFPIGHFVAFWLARMALHSHRCPKLPKQIENP